MAKVNRKLATLLATDCVDFSKHMESQEELTLSNLTSCREIIDPVIEEHGGRIFHTAGDSVIAEFGSPVECVNAAMEFQDLLAARNEAISDGLKLQWRVGIHVDDVIIDPNGASPFKSLPSGDFLSIPVDIFDELCCWEAAEIYRIFTICRDGIDLFCFRIRFSHWDKHFNTDMFVHWHGNKWNDGSTDDSASICKHRTRAFHSWDAPLM